MRMLKISAALAVHTATADLLRCARLPQPAQAPHSMTLLAEAMQFYCEFGRWASLAYQGYTEDPDIPAEIKKFYGHLVDLFASLPKHADRSGKSFLEAADTFRNLDKIISRNPPTAQPAITIAAANAVQTAVSALTTSVRMPVSGDGPQFMTLLADSMQHLSDVGARLDATCRYGSEHDIVTVARTHYSWLSANFTALRHNANETRAVFLNAHDVCQQIKNTSRART